MKRQLMSIKRILLIWNLGVSSSSHLDVIQQSDMAMSSSTCVDDDANLSSRRGLSAKPMVIDCVLCLRVTCLQTPFFLRSVDVDFERLQVFKAIDVQSSRSGCRYKARTRRSSSIVHSQLSRRNKVPQKSLAKNPLRAFYCQISFTSDCNYDEKIGIYHLHHFACFGASM